MQNSFKWHKFLVHRAQRWPDTMIFNNFLMKRSLCSCPCVWSGIEFSTWIVSTLKKFGVLGYLGLGCLTGVYHQTGHLKHYLLLEGTFYFLLSTAAKETGPFSRFSVNTLYRTQKLQLTWLFPCALPAARDFKVWIFSKTRLTFLLVASSLSVLLEKSSRESIQGRSPRPQDVLHALTLTARALGEKLRAVWGN